jgi:endonuclease/exonuclease/phosphatase family metal-dependent hydrolase
MLHTAPTVVVASYNIHRAVGLDGQRSPTRIAAVIDRLDADVIALQEVEWGLPAHEAWLEMYAERRGYALLVDPNIEDHRGRFGNVLLTRHPVRQVDRIDLKVGRFEPRGAIAARINFHGAPHLVVATHLGLRIRERRRQTAQIAAYLNGCEPMPSILLGDLNEWQWRSRSIRAIAKLYEKAPSPRSFPSWRPMFALDRILFRNIGDHPIVRTYRTPLSRIASDHLPVVARFHVAASTGAPRAIAHSTELSRTGGAS